MLTESTVQAGHDRANDRGWFAVSQKSRLLQIYAYTLRARRMLGRMGAQSRAAKRHRLQFYEDVWREAAGELGATVEVLSKEILEISRGGVNIRVHENYTPLDDGVTVRISRSKPIVRTLLRAHGLPTPNDAEFSLNELKKAYRFLAQHRLCVVKPANGTGSGVGITTGLAAPGQLFRAAVRAAGYGPTLLIEEQVEGDTIRLLYLDGQLLDAVRRGPPTVFGDGKSRISQLVEKLNQRRLNAGYKLAQVILKYDMDMERTLARQDLSWRSVPADGQRIVLKGVINDNMADENVSVVDQVCESIIAAGRLATELIGARLAGVDIITPDVRQGLEEAGGKILEVNTTPGYHYHYFTQNGTSRVAVPILKTCLEHGIVTSTSLKAYVTKPNGIAPLPPVILFGGFFQAFQVVESLAGRSIVVYALNDRWNTARFSRLARAIRLPANAPYPQAATAFLTGSASDHLQGSVLLAAGDVELEIMAKHRDTLSHKFLLDLSNPAAQLIMLDKLATYAAAKEAGVATPRFWQVRSEKDLYCLREELVYPLIVKPKVSHVFQKRFRVKFFLAEGFNELLESYRTAKSAAIEVLLVEKIPGPDSRCCSYYTYLDEEGNALFDFTKRVIRRYPMNMGLASYHITDRVEHIRELSLKLFRYVGLQGLANAEFKYDERDGQLKLMECNARFTAANTLVARAGFDLGTFVYNRIVGISQPPLTEFRTGLRLWDPLKDWRAFLELRKRGELTLLQWLASVMHRSSLPYFSWRDPLPSLLRLTSRRSGTQGVSAE